MAVQSRYNSRLNVIVWIARSTRSTTGFPRSRFLSGVAASNTSTCLRALAESIVISA